MKHHLPPSPKNQGLLGHIIGFSKNPLTYLMRITLENGPILYSNVLGYKIVLINHPDDVKYVLQENNKNYVKTSGYKPLELLLGKGLITSEGPLWLRQRRLFQPAFSRNNIQQYTQIVCEEIADMKLDWETKLGHAQPIGIFEEMMKLTLGIVGKTLFSSDISNQSDLVGEELSFVLEYINHRTSTYPFNLPTWLPTHRNRRFAKARKRLDGLIYDIIRKREASDEKYDDLLSRMMAAREEETGQGMSKQQLRDEVMTIFSAGHETTANALAWTWYLIGQHPAVRQQLQEEIEESTRGEIPGFQHLRGLTYTSQVLEESMRLYPPVWMIGRRTIQADKIRGYDIPPDVDVAISPYVMHHHPDFWKEVEQFDPTRFSKENRQSWHPWSHIPFGGGPRLCIGENFAMMEMMLILATLLQSFDFSLLPDQQVEIGSSLTLRPKEEILFSIQKRIKELTH